MTLASTIRQLFAETLAATDKDLSQELNNDTILLESGLDSIGFAILVARLEEELGYDPFILMAVPVYPRTFGEFVDIYTRFKPVQSV